MQIVLERLQKSVLYLDLGAKGVLGVFVLVKREHLVFFVLCFPLTLHHVAHTKDCVMALRRTQSAAGIHTNMPVSFMDLHLC